jgi:hypothetical protein
MPLLWSFNSIRIFAPPAHAGGYKYFAPNGAIDPNETC